MDVINVLVIFGNFAEIWASTVSKQKPESSSTKMCFCFATSTVLCDNQIQLIYLSWNSPAHYCCRKTAVWNGDQILDFSLPELVQGQSTCLALTLKFFKIAQISESDCAIQRRRVLCSKAWSPYSRKGRKHVLATMFQRAYYSSPGVNCKNLLWEIAIIKNMHYHVKNCLLIARIILTESLVRVISTGRAGGGGKLPPPPKK